mgnify:CR=1 FL=1
MLKGYDMHAVRLLIHQSSHRAVQGTVFEPDVQTGKGFVYGVAKRADRGWQVFSHPRRERHAGVSAPVTRLPRSTPGGVVEVLVRHVRPGELRNHGVHRV